MKITTGWAICLVPAVIFLLMTGCGDSGGHDGQEITSQSREPLLAETTPVDGFTIVPIPPDTMYLDWSGEGRAEVIHVAAEPGMRVEQGDTLFRLISHLTLIELDRLRMELEMTRARLAADPLDTLLASSSDSLLLLLERLQEEGSDACAAPAGGILTGVSVILGDEVSAGQELAGIILESSQLYDVHPPEHYRIESWPAEEGELRLVEQMDDRAVYSGRISQEMDDFTSFLAVPREAVFESDLESYLITAGGDTVSVLRIGSAPDGMILVLPSRSVNGQLSTWKLQ